MNSGRDDEDQSYHALEIFKPVDVECLFCINAVVSKGFQDLIGDLAFIFKEVVDSIKNFFWKRFHFRACVGVRGVKVQASFFGFCIRGCKIQGADFISLSHNGVDSHSFLLSLASHTNGHFIHFSIVFIFSLFFFLILFIFLIAKVGGSFDVGD